MGTIGGGNHFAELQAIEKAREAKCPRYVHANFLQRAGELLSQMMQRTINVTQ